MSTDNKQNKIEKLSAELAKAKREIETLQREKRRVGLSFHRIPETGHDISRLWNGDFPYLQKIPNNCLEKPVTDETFHADANTVLIEADNLAALMAMQLTHKGKIDVIYIDPPYNTGNNDFIYNDARKSSIKDVEGASASDYEANLDGKARMVGKDDPERHSLWLSFMERRLWLAKELLSPSGVIYVSIDDNEQAKLKVLMDTVFGEFNFAGQFVWVNNPKGRQMGAFGPVGTYEYILCYSRNADNLEEFRIESSLLKELMPRAYKGFNFDMKTDSKGEYFITNELYNSNSGFNEKTRPNLVYDIYYNPETGEVIPEDVSDSHIHNGFVKITPHVNADAKYKYHAYRWGREKLLREKEDLEFIKQSDGSYKIYSKRRDTTTSVKNLITDIDGSAGRIVLEKILSNKVFDYPKPVQLIKLLVSITSKKDAVILDFFAGSGTTSHAVAQLNKEDGGSRQCILVTHGDEDGKNIAEDVTAERMKRVLSGKNWADGKEHDALTGGLYYYKLLFAPKTANPLTAMETMQTRFTGLAALEQDAHVELENEPNYTVLMNGEKIVVVWKNEDALLDEPEADFYPLLERTKIEYPNKKYIVYTPSTSSSDSDEYGVQEYGWQNYSFPIEYIDSHSNLLERMKRNKTMLQPYEDLTESNINDSMNSSEDFSSDEDTE